MITVSSRRILLKSYRIWRESSVEVKGREYVVLCDSISQEEFRRFVDLVVIDKEGYITKIYPNLPRVIIRPR